MPFSRGSSQPRDRTQVSLIAGRFFTIWATTEAFLWAGAASNLSASLRNLCFSAILRACCCCCCQVTSVVSDSVQPHRWQPTSLPRPWGSPGKKTGVGCRFLLQCRELESESEVTQSCPTLSDPMDCSLPGSSVHGIFQARVLEWGATAFSSQSMLFTNICGKKGEKVGKMKGETTENLYLGSYSVRSVQSLSYVQLCDPWTAACQASLSITNSWSLLRLMSIKSVMPSNHLILCGPLLLLPSIFPSIKVFSRAVL